MSVLGFIAEANLMTEAGGKPLSSDQSSRLTTYRNLTYAGPVIMGLGGITVVAALVLTFEVRDTLGIKSVSTKTLTENKVLSERTIVIGSISGENNMPRQQELKRTSQDTAVEERII